MKWSKEARVGVHELLDTVLDSEEISHLRMHNFSSRVVVEASCGLLKMEVSGPSPDHAAGLVLGFIGKERDND